MSGTSLVTRGRIYNGTSVATLGRIFNVAIYELIVEIIRATLNVNTQLNDTLTTDTQLEDTLTITDMLEDILTICPIEYIALTMNSEIDLVINANTIITMPIKINPDALPEVIPNVISVSTMIVDKITATLLVDTVLRKELETSYKIEKPIYTRTIASSVLTVSEEVD